MRRVIGTLHRLVAGPPQGGSSVVIAIVFGLVVAVDLLILIRRRGRKTKHPRD
jgi:hypothetical protein